MTHEEKIKYRTELLKCPHCGGPETRVRPCFCKAAQAGDDALFAGLNAIQPDA